MTSTWKIRHHHGPSPEVETVQGDYVTTDDHGNLAVVAGQNEVVALFKRDAWLSVTKDVPVVREVVVTRQVVWVPPHLVERYIELVI